MLPLLVGAMITCLSFFFIIAPDDGYIVAEKRDSSFQAYELFHVVWLFVVTTKVTIQPSLVQII